ncbi:MAG: nodulation factor transporter ATP-binding protein NodI [Fibrobacteres bacterium]|nr:nodulation factor transporter ATP-binding protein NodI [Fibrobacterota bacterium]
MFQNKSSGSAPESLAAPSAPPYAVDAKGLAKTFPGGIEALEHMDLRLGPGELAGIVGPNGSGKSTLLNLLAGALVPTEGTVQVLGGVPGNAVRRRTAYIPQEPSLDPEMTVGETLRLFAVLHGMDPAEAGKRIHSLLAHFDLEAVVSRRVSRCSGGMRQRLHVALGFLPDSDLLLCDEPTQALDPAGKEAFWQFLESRVKRGAGALVTLHDLHEAAERCGRILMMARGRVRADGPPQALIDRHGAWVWKAVLFRPAPDAAGLRRELEAVPEVSAVTLGHTALTLRMAGAGPDDSVLNKILERQGAQAEVYERRRPDLLSVFQGLGIPSVGGETGEAGKGRRAGNGGGGGLRRRSGKKDSGNV